VKKTDAFHTRELRRKLAGILYAAASILWHLCLPVPVEGDDLEATLSRWIQRERFVAFPKVSGVGLNEMASLGKLLAIFVIDNKDSEAAEKSRHVELYIVYRCDWYRPRNLTTNR